MVVPVRGNILTVPIVKYTQHPGIAVVQSKVVPLGKGFHTGKIEDHPPVIFMFQHLGYLTVGKVMGVIGRPRKLDGFGHNLRASVQIRCFQHKGDGLCACPVFLEFFIHRLYRSVGGRACRPLDQMEGRGSSTVHFELDIRLLLGRQIQGAFDFDPGKGDFFLRILREGNASNP